jgi:hypothetical protein
MKTYSQLSGNRVLIDYGDGRTVLKDSKHQVLETVQRDGNITELVMEKQPNGYYLPQLLSIRDSAGNIQLLEELLPHQSICQPIIVTQ